VVFRARPGSTGATNLYSAPIDGSAQALQLTQLSGGSLFGFALEGTSVLYTFGGNIIRLYQVPILGGASPTVLNGPLVAGGDVWTFQTRPGFVVYTADEDTNDVIELYYSTLP
jgi:hypothetical protein